MTLTARRLARAPVLDRVDSAEPLPAVDAFAVSVSPADPPVAVDSASPPDARMSAAGCPDSVSTLSSGVLARTFRAVPVRFIPPPRPGPDVTAGVASVAAYSLSEPLCRPYP
ncbi:hypothetical protein [Nocardia sp. NPDC060249]|uniref:hypothetical protein n=1 Tax=Nocardia sp. NPDC060249 TaxID=3347082 RepID=UPI0036539CEE